MPAIAIETAVTPFLGEGKSLDSVESARTALEKLYHDAGYLTVLVSIPPQKIVDATVRLSVLEAPIDRLRVVDARYFSPGAIKQAVPALAEGNVTNFAQMQQELGALNRSPDRRVSPVLRPGKTPGTVEADLKVQDELPLHGSVDINNRYSEGTTPTRVGASLRWDNLWDAQHSLGVSLQGVPEQPNESRVFSLNYTWPQPSGDILALYGVHSESDVAAVGDINVLGKGNIYGLRYIMQLPATERFFHNATLGVDYKDFKQDVSQQGGGGFGTPIYYLPLVAGWEGVLQDARYTTKFGVNFNFHLPGTAGTDQQFADKRYRGVAGYSYLRGSYSHLNKVAEDASLGVRGTWQLAGQALISNEQFSLGGADTVRGYYESAATGETGMALSLEASSPNLAKLLDTGLEQDVRALVFMDNGWLTVIDPITATDRFFLSSWGVGLRINAPRGTSFAMDWAVAMNAVGNSRQGDNRLHFRVAYEW
jgi:hemolysin activation/secretion protein